MVRKLRWALAFGVFTVWGCADDAREDSSEDPAGEGGGAVVPVDEGQPIDAPAMKWTYVELPGTTCRDGKTTGIGVNINPDSDKLVIYMQGGGACFNDLTCQANPTSWDPGRLEGDTQMTAMLLRSEPNPMADWNMVFVPYCSGDVFTGTNPKGYGGGPMTGYTNFTKALERLVPTFKDKVDEVVLTGVSAGGFGAAWNWMRTQDAFAGTAVHALDDSGQPLGTKYLTTCMQQHMTALWGWEKSVHPACKDCNVESGDIVRPMIEAAIARDKSGARFALLTNNEDGVIKGFFAFGLNDCMGLNGNIIQQTITAATGYPAGMFPEGIDEMRASVSKYDNVAIFEIPAASHVVLGSETGWKTAVSDVTVLDWTKQFLSGDKAWGNVQP